MPDLSRDVVVRLTERELIMATAESCTGGMIASAITDIPGSSWVLDRGFVTYSNKAKHQMLGVDMGLFEDYGAVSPAVAKAMAEGGLKASGVDLCVSCTGIAGPGGATETKPVGLVFIGLAQSGKDTIVHKHIFDGDRGEVRSKTVQAALKLILDQLA